MQIGSDGFIRTCRDATSSRGTVAAPLARNRRMHHFEAVRSLIGSLHTLRQNDPVSDQLRSGIAAGASSRHLPGGAGR